jgi:hypothetical protein
MRSHLTERERLVFILYYHEELETSEIAFVLEETLFAVLQLHVQPGTALTPDSQTQKTGCRSWAGYPSNDRSVDPGTGNSRKL